MQTPRINTPATSTRHAPVAKSGVVAAVVGIFFALTGCTSAAGPTATTASGTSPSRNVSPSTPGDDVASVGVTRIPVTDRQPAPPLAGRAIGPGQATSLTVADFAGSVVVVNAWASWCPPCREEIPGIIVTAGLTRSLGVIVLGLNVSDDASAASAFIADSGMNYPSIVDPEGTLLTTIPGVPPQALPSTIIMDRAGRIAVRIIGPVSGDSLEQLIREVADEQAT